MNPRVHTILGLASVMPIVWLSILAVTLNADPARLVEASLAGYMAIGTLVAMGAGLIAIGMFIVRTAGDRDRNLAWKLSWVLGLSAFGILLAPAYWFIYVRSPHPESVPA